MRFLILNTDYPEFLADLYGSNPGLAEASYADQLEARYASLFSVADYYSRNLRGLGHEAWELYVNNEPLQRAWAREHGIELPASVVREWRLRRGFLPWRVAVPDDRWMMAAARSQIEHYRPDVIVNQDVHGIGDPIIKAAKPFAKLTVAQLAATQPPVNRDWSLYDLAISSFPATLERFRDLGVRAELHRLGFEPRVLSAVGERPRSIPVSFVGSFQGAHLSRSAWLEKVVACVPVQVWTGSASLGDDSPIRRVAQGSAWGRRMYEILAASKITLNHHGDVGPYANNLRLFEATGMGALLITDWKPNLSEYFDVGREVVAYRSPGECVEQVIHYLDHEDERVRIAAAGQSRTLTEHTWARRMGDFVSIVERYLA